jgi:hypothetical protein
LLTATPSLCSGCSYTWAITSGAGSIPYHTGNIADYNISGSSATITATYQGTAGCSTSSAPITVTTSVPAAPTVTLPSCIGNGFDPAVASNATANITITNYPSTDPGTGSYTLAYDASNTAANTDILTDGTYSPTLISGSWVLQIPIRNLCNTNGTGGGTGIYSLKYNSTVSCTSSATLVTVSDVSPITVIQSDPIDHSLDHWFLSASPATDPTLLTPLYTWYDCSTNIKQLSPEQDFESYIYKIGDDGTDGSTTLFSAQAFINGCLYRSTITPVGAPFGFRPAYTQAPVATDTTGNLVNIYPNPNKGNFTINIQKVIGKASANLYEANGKLIRQINLVQGRNQINEYQLANGAYYLIISVDGQTYHNNIVIAK